MTDFIEDENTPEDGAVTPPDATDSAGVTDDKPRRTRGRQKAAEAVPSWRFSFLPEALAEKVEAECARQRVLWGEQNHPLHGGRNPKAGIEFHAKSQQNWKGWNDGRVDDGTLGWDGILLEEVYEALTEVDSGSIEEEVVQVIAVCVSLLDSLERQVAQA